jgi:TrmH family RNA methyltransferase
LLQFDKYNNKVSALNLYKLEKLPRNQRLRKIAKIFAEAENRICLGLKVGNSNMADLFSANEIQFFDDVIKSLASDALFPPEVQAVFGDIAGKIIDSPCTSVSSVVNYSSRTVPELQRAFNTIKHLLLNETGRYQADWDFTGSDGRLDPAKRHVFEGMLIYLEDIRSPYNVGAMFRSAESFGAEKIFLSPFCADPGHQRAQRTAMGCVEVLPWERRNFFAATEGAESPGTELPYAELSCPVFALETGGIPLADFPFPRRGLLIAGSEELGISPRALAAADASLGRVSIPCYGAKGSLNVSVAFGIVLQVWAEKMMALF